MKARLQHNFDGHRARDTSISLHVFPLQHFNFLLLSDPMFSFSYHSFQTDPQNRFLAFVGRKLEASRTRHGCVMDASWMRYGRSWMLIDAHGCVKEASRRVHGAHGRVHLGSACVHVAHGRFHVASMAAHRRTLVVMDASWMHP